MKVWPSQKLLNRLEAAAATEARLLAETASTFPASYCQSLFRNDADAKEGSPNLHQTREEERDQLENDSRGISYKLPAA